MTNRKYTKRQAALRRRRLFFASCFAVLAAVVLIIAGVISLFTGDKNTAKSTPKKSNAVTKTEKKNDGKFTFSEENEPVLVDDKTFDANYTRLLLVNEENPLPEDYNYGQNTVKIESKYLNGGNDRFDAGAYPFLTAMIDAARNEGVNLYVWSPYRSYNDQRMVFENNVKKLMNSSPISREDAEKEVRKTVLYPGTSEHHTGLCCDFNMADYKFNDTAMYSWLLQNAEKYGFVMRYSKEKEDITAVNYETWHWRFVGINRAKEMNQKKLCLEEFCKLSCVDQQKELAKK